MKIIKLYAALNFRGQPIKFFEDIAEIDEWLNNGASWQEVEILEHDDQYYFLEPLDRSEIKFSDSQKKYEKKIYKDASTAPGKMIKNPFDKFESIFLKTSGFYFWVNQKMNECYGPFKDFEECKSSFMNWNYDQ